MKKSFAARSFVVLVILGAASNASAESGVIDVDAMTDQCVCNANCTGGSVCVEGTMGVRVCCPSGETGCPADPGEGILCPSEIDGGRAPDDATTIGMDAGVDGAEEAGCSIASGRGSALPALLIGIAAFVWYRRSTRSTDRQR